MPDTDNTQRSQAQPGLPVIDIVCVDREVLTLGILGARFEHTGWQARLVKSAGEALETIHEQVPDILMTEVQLEASNGYQLIKTVRSDPDPLIRSLPILILSHIGQPEDILFGLGLEATGYMTKPFDIVKLEEDLISLAGAS